jgi:uncharacterized membrane protein
MALPGVIGGLVCPGLLLLYFRKQIPAQLPRVEGIKSEDAIKAIKQPGTKKNLSRKVGNLTGAGVGWTIAGVICFCLLLVTLVSSTWIAKWIKLWTIVLVFAGIMFLMDLTKDLLYWRAHPYTPLLRTKKAPEQEVATEMANTESTNNDSASSDFTAIDSRTTMNNTKIGADAAEEDQEISDFVTVSAFFRMPWVTVPFVLGMFAMVQALTQAGWLTIWAGWLANIARTLGTYGTIFFFAFLTSGACALLNNQPMTILFTQILLTRRFSHRVPRRVNFAAMMSLIMGSNFGGDLTLIGYVTSSYQLIERTVSYFFAVLLLASCGVTF